MKTYLIYHVPGKKIGCTCDLHKRMRDQGFTQWEILEEHNCIYEVSDREIQLQKDYGLPVDKVPYWQSVQNRHVWSDAARTKGQDVLKQAGYEHVNKAATAAGKKHLKLTKTQVEEIKSLYATGNYSQRKLGKMFGVSQYPIKLIVNGWDSKLRT